MIRSRYLLLSDASYRDGKGRTARLAYSARRATLFAVDPGTASALDSCAVDAIAAPQLATLTELKAVVAPGEDELAEVLSGLRQRSADPGTRVFTIMPTSWCNMACSYCGQEHERVPAQLEPVAARVEAALRDPLTKQVSVNWFGGEPLLALRSIRALSERFLAVGKPYKASMATNGSLLTVNTLPMLHTECALESVEITIDGPPEVHDHRRLKRNGTGSFDRIIAALRAAPATLRVSVRVNIDSDNEPYVEELIRLLADLGLARPGIELHLAPIHSWGNDVSKVEIAAREYARLEAGWLRLAASLGFHFATLPTALKRTTCVATTVNAEVVDSQGRVYSCSEHPLVPGVSRTGVVAKLSDLAGSIPRPRGSYDDWFDEVGGGTQQCGQCPILPVCGGACPKLWREGHLPCPSMKFNFSDRFDLAAARLGFTRID